MQEAPKRQCILTRKTLPAGILSSPLSSPLVFCDATHTKDKIGRERDEKEIANEVDYLLKLKPRSYPAGDGADTTYLTPSVFSKCDPGRSHYLTLHREVIARIHEPGTTSRNSSLMFNETKNMYIKEQDHI